MEKQKDALKQKTLYKMINQHVLSKAVMLACEMRLDKILDKKDVDISSLSVQYSYNKAALKRLLRVLDAYDIVNLQEMIFSF